MSPTAGPATRRESRPPSSSLLQVTRFRAFGVDVSCAREARAARTGSAQQQPFAERQGCRDVDADDALEAEVGREVRERVSGLVPGDREARAVVFELMPQLPSRVERVVLDHDRSQPQHGVERHDMLRAVREHERDPIALADAQSPQSLGCACDLRAEFAVARDGAEELQSGPTSVSADAGIHHLGKRLGGFVDLARNVVRILGEPGTRHIRIRRHASILPPRARRGHGSVARGPGSCAIACEGVHPNLLQ